MIEVFKPEILNGGQPDYHWRLQTFQSWGGKNEGQLMFN